MRAIASLAWATKPSAYACRVLSKPGRPPMDLLYSAQRQTCFSYYTLERTARYRQWLGFQHAHRPLPCNLHKTHALWHIPPLPPFRPHSMTSSQ